MLQSQQQVEVKVENSQMGAQVVARNRLTKALMLRMALKHRDREADNRRQLSVRLLHKVRVQRVP